MVGAMPVNIIPNFYNNAMETCKNGGEEEEADIQVTIGSRVKCSDNFGTVKYIGEIKGYKGCWYGVEWDDPARGKHDGSVDGIEYFKTAKAGAGSFVRPNKIAPMQTCAEAIKKYYGDNEDETLAAHRQLVINEWKREMRAPFIEMVGFDKIHQKQVAWEALTEVCVHDQRVAGAGRVGALVPAVRALDVSRNLFANWREVITLTAQLPRLETLDLSNNRMAVDMTVETLKQFTSCFQNLGKIHLSGCDYEWSDILILSHLWPNLVELVAANNRISKIVPPEVPGTVLQSLTTLKLDGNPIGEWSEVVKLDFLKNLQVLSLNECAIKEIRFGEETKTDIFSKLNVLFLNRNEINDWRSVSELDKLSSLTKLYFLKNPLQESDAADYDTYAYMIIARVGGLTELNGSEIRAELRRGAEYDYVYKFGAQWKRARDRDEPRLRTRFAAEHTRFQHLIDKYGIPDDSLLDRKPKDSTLTSKLIEINLKNENGNIVKKKFPSTMMVQKLATLAQRLFPRNGHKGFPQLFCVDKERNTEIILDNVTKDLNFFSVVNGDTILVRWL